MYHIITAEKKSYICILGTQFLMPLCRVNNNEQVARGQSLTEGRLIWTHDCCGHTLIGGEIEMALFWLQVTVSLTQGWPSCQIIMSHLFALYSLTH